MGLILGAIRLVFRVLSVLGIAALVVIFLLNDFISRTNDSDSNLEIPRTVVVFTGAYDRIDMGLSLLSSRSADRLFITGANRTSGLIESRFPELFNPNSEQADWFARGQIVLAPDAHSTLENGLETACWLDYQPEVEAVTLITSRRHMARASLALQRSISPISIVRLVSDPSEKNDKYQIDLVEFGRFFATWFITLLPRELWSASELKICRGDQTKEFRNVDGTPANVGEL